MFRRKEGREKKDGERLQTLFYRDYIKSTLWELRKRHYFNRFAKACKVCGDTDKVELNHIRYGNYGHERDADLVPLCHEHHQKLHDTIGVRGNMHYQTEYFLAEEIAKYNEEQEHKIPEVQYEYSPTFFSSTGMILDMMARPIWRLFYGVMPW